MVIPIEVLDAVCSILDDTGTTSKIRMKAKGLCTQSHALSRLDLILVLIAPFLLLVLVRVAVTLLIKNSLVLGSIERGISLHDMIGYTRVYGFGATAHAPSTFSSPARFR